jgi:hypothetical protein
MTAYIFVGIFLEERDDSLWRRYRRYRNRVSMHSPGADRPEGARHDDPLWVLLGFALDVGTADLIS